LCERYRNPTLWREARSAPMRRRISRTASCAWQISSALSQAEAEQVFFNEPLLIVEDVSQSCRETRLHALGHTDAGRPLHISFTLRGDGKLIRLISARAMHRKERLRYEQEA
jgi:uncharacterized protein